MKQDADLTGQWMLLTYSKINDKMLPGFTEDKTALSAQARAQFREKADTNPLRNRKAWDLGTWVQTCWEIRTNDNSKNGNRTRMIA